MGTLEPAQAAERLRTELRDAMARKRLTVQQLADRCGLGRTTVSQALSDAAELPSAETVAAPVPAAPAPSAAADSTPRRPGQRTQERGGWGV